MADTTLTDPLGRTITLHDHTWYGHVLPARPELRSMRSMAEAAVRSPKEIRISKSDPDARLYYGSPSASGVMMVVVAHVVDGHAFTVYRTKRPKGAIEWP